MSDTGQMNYGLGLDVGQANQAIAHLTDRFKQFHGELLHSQNLLQNFTKTFKNLEGMRGSQRLEKRLMSFSKGGVGSVRGTEGQLGDAVIRSMIADVRNSQTQLINRYQQELVRSMVNTFRLTEGRINEMITREQRRSDPRRIAAGLRRDELKNTPEALAAGVRITELQTSVRALQERIQLAERRYSADAINFRQQMDALRNSPGRMASRLADETRLTQLGQAGHGNLKTWERVSNNGGADFLAIQGRLMANYQLLNGLFSSFRFMAGYVVELDKEFRQFQAITAATFTEMGRLEGKLMDVSAATKFTGVEVAQAATLMGQAGLSARQVGEAIEPVTLLATAAGTDLTQAVDVATSTMSVFNLQTSEMGNVANVLTAALNKSKLTIDKLALGFQYAGNIAAQSGITYTELTGILGALANSGIRSGSTLGTGLRQLIVDLEKPSGKFEKTLKSLNLTVADVDIQSKGFTNVLNTLASAGFSASDAFQVFELRAAAAYAALANNVTLANDLQREFMLTTAAVDANKVQMESLANTWTRFQGAAGNVAYKAFKPFLDVLQDVLASITDVLTELSKMPELLELIGAGIAMIGIGAAGSMLVRLVSGLAAFATGLRTVTTAATGASVALTGLMSVIRLHPVGMAIGLLTGLATAVYALSDSKDAIDDLRASVNETDGAIDETEQRLSAIAQTISNLKKQQAALDADPDARITKIMEVKGAFTELATEIDTGTASIGDLIKALQGLQAELSAELPQALDLKITQLERVLKAVNEQRQEEVEGGANRDMVLNSLRSFYGNDRWGNTPRTVRADRAFQQTSIGRFLGPDAQRALEIADGAEQQDPRELEGLITGLKATLEQRLLKQDEPGPDVRGLETFVQYLEAMLPTIAQQESVRQEIRTAQNRAASNFVTNWETSNKQGEAAAKLLEQIRTALFEELKNAPASEQQEIARAIFDRYRPDMNALSSANDTLRAATEKQFPGLDVDSILDHSPINRNLQAITDLSKKAATGRLDVMAEVRKRDVQQQLYEVEQQIKQTMDDTSRASSVAEVDAAKALIERLGEQRAFLTRKIFGFEAAGDEDLVNEDGSYTTEGFFKLQDQIDKVTRENSENADSVTKEIERINREKNQSAINELKKRYDLLGKELDDLRSSIKGLPLEKVSEVVQKMRGIAAEMHGLSGRIYGMESYGSAPNGMGASARSDAPTLIRKIVEQSKAAGLDPLAQLALIWSENPDFNPFQPNKAGGKAFGLAQFMPDTWTEMEKTLGPLNKMNEDDQIRAAVELSRQTMADRELAAMLGRAPNAYDLQHAHLLGLGGYKNALRNLDRPAAQVLGQDVVAGNINRRGWAGTTSDFLAFHKGQIDKGIRAVSPYLDGVTPAGTGEAQAAQEARIYTVNQKVEDGEDAAAARARNATLRAYRSSSAAEEQAVQTLITQARTMADPARVQSQLAEIDTAYAKILDLRKKSLETEYEGREDADAKEEALQNLISATADERNRKVESVMQAWDKAIIETTQKPVEEAKAKLEGAERAGASEIELRGLRAGVVQAEDVANAARLKLENEQLLYIKQQLAATEANTPQYNFWLNEQAEKVEELTQLEKELNATRYRSNLTLEQAIKGANDQFLVQAGIMRETEAGLVRVSPEEQFGNAYLQTLQGLSDAFNQLFMDIGSGTKTAGEMLKQFGLNVLQTFAKIISNALTNQIMELFTSGLGQAAGGAAGAGGSGIMSWLGGLFQAAPVAHSGGMIGSIQATRRLTSAAFVNARRYHRGGLAGDEVPAILQRGEEVLTRRDPRHQLNMGRMINRAALASLRSAGTASNRDLPRGKDDKRGDGGVVNVYVVSKDQIPPLGPRDIVAHVSDDIQRKGTIRQLIKQVAIGAA